MMLSKQRVSIFMLIFGVFFLPINIFGLSFYNFIFATTMLLNLKLLVENFRRERFIILLILFSTVLTCFSTVDLTSHLIGVISFFVTCATLFLFYHLTRKNQNIQFTRNCFHYYVVIIFFMCISEVFFDLEFYYAAGERFGWARPFLFANPISISVSVLGALIYLRFRAVANILSVASMIMFASYTAIASYLIHKSITTRAIMLMAIIAISVLAVNLDLLGSFSVRYFLFTMVFDAFSALTPLQIFTGVGMRGVEEFNKMTETLFLINDITYFAKVTLESGVLGLIILIIFIKRFQFFYSGSILIIFFISVDQIFYFWSLAFLISGLETPSEKIYRKSYTSLLRNYPSK